MLQFSSHPGMHERHLQRKFNNPLFEKTDMSQDEVTAAQARDRENHDIFMPDFNLLIEEVAGLSGQVDQEILDDLKERLDKNYTKISSLPGETAPFKQAIRKLVEVMNISLMRNSENDPLAKSKLEEENTARNLHFDLQDITLVADITNPDSPISEEDLVSSLLGETEKNLVTALPMFSKHQLLQIQANAEIKLTALRQRGQELPQAWRNLEVISGAAEVAPDDHEALN